MRLKTNSLVYFSATVVLLALFTSCQQTTEPKPANANGSLTNSSTQVTPAASPVVAATTEPSTAAAVVSLTTPTETYKTGYAARQNKDIATLKRVFSKDAIEFLTEVSKEEKKTLDDQLKELADRPQAATAETRNEKITGNRASLEYLDEKGKWSQMDFAKEGNDWKIDLPKAP
ncbi:MAG TPA: hypothetical protein VJU86_11700 [Pyrinomonadaceae bacterium]|nr:hypothetical protein [Pyrinomonadaceae bacterium]